MNLHRRIGRVAGSLAGAACGAGFMLVSAVCIGQQAPPTEPAGVPPAAGTEEKLGGGESQARTIMKCLEDLKSGDAEARRRAVLILAKYPDDGQAVAALAGALKDAAVEVRRAAVVSLGEDEMISVGAAESLLPCLGDSDTEVRRLVSSLLPRIVLSLPMHSVPLNDRSTLRTFQHQLPAASGDQIRRAFADEDETVRKNMLACEALLREAIGARELVPRIADASAEVRKMAIGAVRSHLPSEDFLAAVAPLADDPDPMVRRTLVMEVARTYQPAAAPVLRRLVDDPDIVVASQAMQGLFFIQEPVGADKFLRLVQSPDVDPRLAETLIATLPPVTAGFREALLALLKNERAGYRAAALSAFSRVRGSLGLSPAEAWPYLADGSPEVRRRAESIVRLSEDGIPAEDWLALLESPHPDVRTFALTASRKLPDETAEKLLEELLLDESAEVRAAAIGEYSRRKLPGFFDILARSLEDKNRQIQEAAVLGLFRERTPEAMKLLGEFAGRTSHPEVRQLVEVILRQSPAVPPPPAPPAPPRP